jgi:hypothetical protein
VVDITDDEKGPGLTPKQLSPDLDMRLDNGVLYGNLCSAPEEPAPPVQPRSFVSTKTLERITSKAVRAQERFLDQLREMGRKYGDFRLYARITGELPEEAKAREELSVSGPILTPGNYSATIDVPDLSRMKDKAERLTALRDVIEKRVIYDIIERNLEANNSPLHYTFFRPTLSAGADGEVEESRELDISRKDALQPTIDQCVDAVFTGLVAREPDLVEGARVALSYSIDSDGRMAVSSTRRKYFNPHDHKFTIPVQDLSWIGRGLYATLLDVSDPERIEVIGKMDDLSGVLSDDDPKSVALHEKLQGVLAAVSLYEQALTEVSACDTYESSEAALTDALKDFLVAFNTDETKSFILEKVLQRTVERVITGNLRATSHPELKRLTKNDLHGIMHLNDKGREKFYELSGNIVQNLTGRLEGFPKIRSGGLVRARCYIDEEGGIKELRLMYVTLDPAYPIAMRELLPPTTGMPALERGDAYKREARNHAHDAINGNMDAARSPHRHRYPLLEGGVLARLHDKVADEITEGMLSLDERRPLPFYLGMKINEPDEDGEQTVSLVKANKVYLDPEIGGALKIDVRPLPQKKLDCNAMRAVAGSAVAAAIARVVEPHMVEGTHPLLEHCFEEYRGKDGKPARYLNERGAQELEGIITYLAERFSVALLQMRAAVPEHFSGYRAVLRYSVKPDDSMSSLNAAHEYFSPAKDSLTFRLPDMRKTLASVPGERRASVLRQCYETLATGLLTGLLAVNMDGHPAQKGYFQAGKDMRPHLTAAGKAVLGSTLDKNAQSLADQMMKLAGDGRGGNFKAKYGLSHDRLDYVSIHRLWVG